MIVNVRSEKKRAEQLPMKMRRYAAPVCLVMLLQLAVPPQADHAQSSAIKDVNSRASIDANIAPSIQGHERDVMRSVLRRLAPEDRKDVVFVDTDGRQYANTPFMRHMFSPIHRVSKTEFQSERGFRFTWPALTPRPDAVPARNTTVTQGGIRLRPHETVDPPPFPNSGPYVRVWSKPPPNTSSPGYSFESASVTLPSMSSNPLQIDENPNHPRDNACLYIGGWGNGSADTGAALDVGFTHEVTATGDEWVGMWAGGAMTASRGNPKTSGMTGDAVRFYGGQTVTVKFYVTKIDDQNSQLNFIYIGHVYDYATGADVGVKTMSCTAVGPVTAWNPSGNGMILKSMTSIGQQAAVTGTMDDPTTCAFIKNIVWSNAMIGTSPATAHAWGAADTSAASPQVHDIGGLVSVSTNAGSGCNRTDSIIVP